MIGNIPQDLLDKLNKLKNLQEGAVSVGSLAEAENAGAKYQDLLLKWNLSEEDVRNSSIEQKVQMLEESFDTKTQFAWRASDWVHRLLKTVARTSMCDVIIMGNGITNVLGEKQNVALVIYFTEQLISKITIAYRAAWINYNGDENSKLFRRSFLTGAVDAISSRLYNELSKAKKESQLHKTGLEIVLVKKGEMTKKYMDEQHPHSRTVRARSGSTGSISGYMQGKEAGGKMGLNKGVGGGSAGRRLLE